jgi:hypothetical protein
MTATPWKLARAQTKATEMTPACNEAEQEQRTAQLRHTSARQLQQ